MYKVYRDVENEELYVRVNFSMWVTLSDDFIDDGGPACPVATSDYSSRLYLVEYDEQGCATKGAELVELHTFMNGQTELLERFIHNDGEF